ncbi:hypothetical protein Ae201684P_006806 [Aphanomyces euteiches]|uniref:Uncharacterized protein n=1 Tax=Aphanomyces euteiches TaxID=100861 RepID=A0A6G0WV68_9STRA|nr:hypothetical protein Ae201684_011343 [Aphanomyces euteiches]KAH9100610.1 hypothetical protein Ae201684P_006806 [Aphanomyces euteiches]
MQQVWEMTALMRLIVAFQPGYPERLWPFAKYARQYKLHVEMDLTQRTHLFLENMAALDDVFGPYLETPLRPQPVDLLLSNFPELARNIFCYAIWAGHLELLGFILPRVNNTYHSATEMAAFHGQIDVLNNLEEHNLASYSSQTLHWACREGHLKCVEFLHQRVIHGDTIAMDAAAVNGHFEIVKFLHTYRSEGCTANAMDSAAESGHLDIVKFLHLHRSEGCTTAALDMAAANGHLDIVKFLHSNRTDGATTTAMTLACCNGHLDVVKFLFEHRSEGCTSRALNGAREEKHWQVEEFLLQHANKLHIDVSETVSSRCSCRPVKVLSDYLLI